MADVPGADTPTADRAITSVLVAFLFRLRLALSLPASTFSPRYLDATKAGLIDQASSSRLQQPEPRFYTTTP